MASKTDRTEGLLLVYSPSKETMIILVGNATWPAPIETPLLAWIIPLGLVALGVCFGVSAFFGVSVLLIKYVRRSANTSTAIVV